MRTTIKIKKKWEDILNFSWNNMNPSEMREKIKRGEKKLHHCKSNHMGNPNSFVPLSTLEDTTIECFYPLYNIARATRMTQATSTHHVFFYFLIDWLTPYSNWL
jgi:hypothetical protein